MIGRHPSNSRTDDLKNYPRQEKGIFFHQLEYFSKKNFAFSYLKTWKFCVPRIERGKYFPLNIQDNSREKRREKVSRFQFFFLFLFFISKPWRRAEEGIFFPRGFRVTATLQMEIVERINATRRTKQFLQTIFLLKLRA